jgi:hypothetical protein
MYTFQMGDNQITGIIPSTIGNLTNLTGFNLYNNQLTGSLPESLGSLTKITHLFLSNNQLTGTLKVLENFTNPFDLEFYNNQFTGPLPNLQHVEGINSLGLRYNKLSGPIPNSYANFVAGSNAYISDNELYGPIPTALTNLDINVILDIHNNHFNFDSLEYILSNSQHNYFNYSSQLNIPLTYSEQGLFGKFSVFAGGTLSNNTYLWYRNNNLYKTIIGDSTFIVDSPGVYFVKVNNAIVTDLQLISDSIIVNELCTIAPTNAATKKVTPSDALLTWKATPGAIKYQVKYSQANKPKFITINTKKPFIQISGLLANTDYVWEVRAKCQVKYSPFSPLVAFTTPPSFAINGALSYNIQVANGFSVYPNPAIDHIQVAFNSLKQSNYNISIYDIQGKILVSKTGIANAGINNFVIDIHSMHSGVYILKLQYDFGKEEIRKLVKSQ